MHRPNQLSLYRSISKILCLLLLLETSGMGTAWALLPEPEFVTVGQVADEPAEADILTHARRALVSLGETVDETASDAARGVITVLSEARRIASEQIQLTSLHASTALWTTLFSASLGASPPSAPPPLPRFESPPKNLDRRSRQDLALRRRPAAWLESCFAAVRAG
jgi:hypothetical protein